LSVVEKRATFPIRRMSKRGVDFSDTMCKGRGETRGELGLGLHKGEGGEVLGPL